MFSTYCGKALYITEDQWKKYFGNLVYKNNFSTETPSTKPTDTTTMSDIPQIFVQVILIKLWGNQTVIASFFIFFNKAAFAFGIDVG